MDKKEDQNKAEAHLSNERTFLSWIRTATGLMTLGFVAVQFSLFFKQFAILAQSGQKAEIANNNISEILGIILVAAGALVAILAYIRYRQTKNLLRQRLYLESSVLIIFITVCVVSVGLLLAGYLYYAT